VDRGLSEPQTSTPAEPRRNRCKCPLEKDERAKPAERVVSSLKSSGSRRTPASGEALAAVGLPE
jgi:hypothetical protein